MSLYDELSEGFALFNRPILLVSVLWAEIVVSLSIVALLVVFGLIRLYGLPWISRHPTRSGEGAMPVLRVFAVVVLPLAVAFAIHAVLDRVTLRPDPHDSSVVAMAVSSDGRSLASLDARGELRILDVASGEVTNSVPQVPRRIGALHAIPNQGYFLVVDMAGGLGQINPNTTGLSSASPGSSATYLASAVNAEGMIAIAVAREPRQSQQQQQQQQQQVEPAKKTDIPIQQQEPTKGVKADVPVQELQPQQMAADTPYVVEFKNPDIGELLVPSRPTVLAPYVAGPTRAIFPNNSKFQPFLIGFADGTVGIITMQGDGPRLGSSLPGLGPLLDPTSETERPIQLLASSKDGDIASVDTAGRVKYWQIDQASQTLAVKDMPPAFTEMTGSAGTRSAAFSPDGTRIATGSEDGTVRIWDIATKQPIGEPLRHQNTIWSTAFSPDGTRVVTASFDNTARIWDVATGKPVGEPLRHEGSVDSALFSLDGTRVVTASRDNTARIWDAMSGAPVGEPLRHERGVEAAAFSPDGTRVVTASRDGTARIWDAATGKPVGEPLRHESDVWSAAFSPDGTRVVTASSDGTARIWDAMNGRPVGEPLRHEGSSVESAAFSPDGTRVLTVSSDSTARVWDVATDMPVGEPLRHGGTVNSAAFSPDGARVATASSNQTARIWDAATGRPAGEPLRHESNVWFTAFSPDGTQILTVSDNNPLRLWRLRGPTSSSCSDCSGAWFGGEEPRLILADGRGHLIEVDPKSGQITRDQPMPAGVTYALADAQGHALAANRADGEIEWLDTEGEGLVPLGVHADQVSAAAKLPDGHVALGFLDGMVEVVDPRWHSVVAAADIWPETRELALSAISGAAGFWTPPSAPAFPSPGGRLFGLTIGIGNYDPNSQLNLRYAAADARDVAEALKLQSKFYSQVNVQMVTDGAATRRAIFDALEATRRQVEDGDGNDLVVIMFSGHGALLGDGGSKEYYLLPSDIDTRSGISPVSAIAISEFKNRVDRIARKSRVLVLFDVCRTGATSDGTPLLLDGDGLSASLAEANVSILTSTSRNEASLENDMWGNGAFTEVFLEALDGRADKDGNARLSVSELVDYMSERLPALTDGRQNPSFAPRFFSDIFVVGDARGGGEKSGM